ncbi:MAG: hypothetical protein M3Y56_12050, partial [Armatimonadota bacterium]|nr:hypothetical protein [Armatimonadota bacterium]
MVERRQRSGIHFAKNEGGRDPRAKNLSSCGWLLTLSLLGLLQMGIATAATTTGTTTGTIPKTGPTQILTVGPEASDLTATTFSTTLPASVVLPAATSVAVGSQIRSTTTGLVTSSGFVIEMSGSDQNGISSGIAIYDKSGALQFITDLQSWFNPTGLLGTFGQIFDPHVIFDEKSGRFITIALSGLPGQKSHLLIGVSASADPTNIGTWQFSSADMSVDYDGTIRSGMFWNDFDEIGLNQDGIYVTANEYSLITSDPTKPPVTVTGINYAHPKVRVFNRNVIFARTLPPTLDGVATTTGTPPVTTLGPAQYIDFTDFQDSFTGTSAINVQPCHTYGATAANGTALPEYFVSAVPPSNSSGGTNFSGATGRVNLFSISRVTFNGVTSFMESNSATVITQPFSDPPNAIQPVVNITGSGNSPATLGVGDSRLLNAVYRNGFIWTAGSAATVNAAGGAISGIHWLKFDPTVGTGSFFNTTITPVTDSILAARNGDSTYLPSITADASNTTYISYDRSGLATFPSLEAVVLPASVSGFATILPISTGSTPWQCTQDYGVYGGIATDPSDDTSVWVAGEFGGDNIGFSGFGGGSDCTAQTELARLHTGPSPYVANYLTGNGLTESAATSIAGNQIVGYAYGPITGNVIHAIGWAGLQSLGVDLTPTPSVLPGASAPVGANIGQSHAFSTSGLSIGGDFTPAGSAAGTLHAAVLTAPPAGSTVIASLPIDLNPNGFLSSTVNAVSGPQQVGYGRMIGGDFRALLWSGTK